MNNLPLLNVEEMAIAKAKVELVLRLVTDEARLLEKKKAEMHVRAKPDGLTDAEINALILQYPPGVFSI